MCCFVLLVELLPKTNVHAFVDEEGEHNSFC